MQEVVTDRSELEARLLYSAIVAGKSAAFADAVTKRFMKDCGDRSPFSYLRSFSFREIEGKLKEWRTGNYTKLCNLFSALAWVEDLDLATAGPRELEKFHGIGPKTSRFFIMWTRPEEKTRYAALDTHVLKWLSYLGHKVPKSTPTGPKYRQIELKFLAECDRRDRTARDVDAAIWDWCSNNRAAAVAGQWPEDLRRIEP